MKLQACRFRRARTATSTKHMCTKGHKRGSPLKVHHPEEYGVAIVQGWDGDADMIYDLKGKQVKYVVDYRLERGPLAYLEVGPSSQ